MCEGNGDNECKKCFKIGEESACEVGDNEETESYVTGRHPLPWYGGNSTKHGSCWTSTAPTALHSYSKLVLGA